MTKTVAEPNVRTAATIMGGSIPWAHRACEVCAPGGAWAVGTTVRRLGACRTQDRAIAQSCER
eukprot:272294-Prymnesium_polylepis.2